MSEFVTKRRVIAAALTVGMGAAGIAACSGNKPAASKQATGKPYESAGPSLPPLAVPGEIMHCRTDQTGDYKRPMTNAGYPPSVAQEIAKIFHVPVQEIDKHGWAFVSSCDRSLTGSIVSHVGEIPEMSGDPQAAGKECLVWEALYHSQADAKADAPLNTFVVVCDTAKAEVHPSAAPTPSHTSTQA